MLTFFDLATIALANCRDSCLFSIFAFPVTLQYSLAIEEASTSEVLKLYFHSFLHFLGPKNELISSMETLSDFKDKTFLPWLLKPQLCSNHLAVNSSAISTGGANTHNNECNILHWRCIGRI